MEEQLAEAGCCLQSSSRLCLQEVTHEDPHESTTLGGMKPTLRIH